MMQKKSAYLDDPRRGMAEQLLDTLFSSTPRPAGEVLAIARKAESHPGIGFFKLPVPYDIKVDGTVIKSGLSDSMLRAVGSVIGDLEAIPADALVIVDIDEKRLPVSHVAGR